ncbi:MAG: glycosyltransferase [Alistipes sp.]|nr:glycosyltransferase [Alistipes sp.]
MKKKILFLTGPLGGGGAERVLVDILRNFDYDRYDVDLALISAEGVLLPEVPPQVNVISLWNGYALEYKIAYRLSKYLGCNALFAKTLRERLPQKYDVEISFLEGMPLKLHAMISSSARKITWVHCDLDKFRYEASQFFDGEEIAAYNKMDEIVIVSQDAKKAFDKRFPDCRTHKRVIYNPIDRDKIVRMSSEMEVHNDKFTIVTVGRLTLQKAIDRVVRLARRLKDEGIDVLFKIIGEGELRQDLSEQISRYGVQDSVELCGFMNNPFPVVKSADMMLCPSFSEGFCLVICEAMCLGVPIVSTKTSGPCEIIGDNEFGILCEHNDESIYRAVKCMIEDKALREYYGEKSLQKASSFDIDSTMQRIYEVIG